MSDDQLTNLTNEQKASISAARSEFLERMKLGEKTSIEKQLAEVDSGIRFQLLHVLMTAEVEYRLWNGVSPEPSEYKERFPDSGQLVDDVFASLASQETVSIPGQRLSSGADNPATIEKKNPDERRAEQLPHSFGRYELRRMLGQGGMGSVYLAHDQELDRDVAIKFPIFNDDPDQRAVSIERFRREARSMATLRHPNLCPVYDVGEHDGRHFLTMAYIQGRTLSGVSLSQDQVIRTVAVIADAVQAAHDAGIVHRDLKPANVMIDPQGEPVIMDFGLALREAHAESELTRSGTIIGSPAYMAPEQVNAQHDCIGPKTDVYAIGVLLYRLLTGKVPFDGPGLSVLGEISSGKSPKPPSEIVSVDERLETVCLTAMAHRAEDRYASAEELAHALRSCISRESSTIVLSESHGLQDVDRFQTGASTIPVAVKVAAAIALVGVFVGLAMTFGPDDDDQEAEATVRVVETGEAPSSPKEDSGDPAESPVVSSKSAAELFTSNGYKWTYPEPVLVSESQQVNNASTPFITPDERQLYFTDASRGSIGITTRHGNDEMWSSPVPFDSLAATSKNDGSPTLTRDRKSIVFASQREGGFGYYDLWMATRDDAGSAFNEPVNLGPVINGAGDDGAPSISGDGLALYFHSDRAGGYGGYDLWVCDRDSVNESFGAPKNLGPEINGDAQERYPALSPDGTALLYSRWGHQMRICVRADVGQEFNVSSSLGGFPAVDERLSLTVLNDAAYFCYIGSGDSDEVHVTRRVPLNDPTDVPRDSAAWNLLSDDYQWSLPEELEFGDAPSVMAPFVSHDGEHILLTTWLAGTNSLDIAESRKHGQTWSAPVAIPGINSSSSEHKATLSDDGRIIVFASRREGGVGQIDLWMATRKDTSDKFDEPVSLGPGINSAFEDNSPEISADGLNLVFDSDRDSEPGSIWISERESVDVPFGPARNLDEDLNSSLSGIHPTLSADATALVFSRYGRLYLATRSGVSEPFSVTELPKFSGVRQNVSPQLSSNGRTLYFTVFDYDGQGDREIWVVRRVKR